MPNNSHLFKSYRGKPVAHSFTDPQISPPGTTEPAPLDAKIQERNQELRSLHSQ